MFPAVDCSVLFVFLVEITEIMASRGNRKEPKDRKKDHATVEVRLFWC